MAEHHSFLQLKFQSLEPFRALVQDWDVDFLQLDHGSFLMHFMQLITKDFQFGVPAMNRIIEQRGASPKGLWSFAILAAPVRRLNWHGRDVTTEDIMIYKPHSEIGTVSDDHFKVYVFSIGEQTIEEYCDNRQHKSVLPLLRTTDMVRIARPQVEQLRSKMCLMEKYLRTARSENDLDKKSLINLKYKIMDALLRCFGVCTPREKSASLKIRNHAFNQALACIEMQLKESITINGLCKTAGVSDRTIRYAFQERFGISPKCYIRALRLNRLHRDLLLADPETVKISTIANSWKLGHMGQMAKDYRRMFHELPSETLAKNLDVKTIPYENNLDI